MAIARDYKMLLEPIFATAYGCKNIGYKDDLRDLMQSVENNAPLSHRKLFSIVDKICIGYEHIRRDQQKQSSFLRNIDSLIGTPYEAMGRGLLKSIEKYEDEKKSVGASHFFGIRIFSLSTVAENVFDIDFMAKLYPLPENAEATFPLMAKDFIAEGFKAGTDWFTKRKIQAFFMESHSNFPKNRWDISMKPLLQAVRDVEAEFNTAIETYIDRVKSNHSGITMKFQAPKVLEAILNQKKYEVLKPASAELIASAESVFTRITKNRSAHKQLAVAEPNISTLPSYSDLHPEGLRRATSPSNKLTDEHLGGSLDWRIKAILTKRSGTSRDDGIT